jgi:hypothetical protein
MSLPFTISHVQTTTTYVLRALMAVLVTKPHGGLVPALTITHN